ncbi:hypothetical protein [Natrinema sp. 74]|uniref:hypothetical protein n=1 Tax=Natrinema sp. 74 TaxID=3384159 RepID=UPI0038D3FED4
MVSRRGILAATGTLGVGGLGAYVLLGCRSNIDIDEGDIGSQATVTGRLSIKSRDNRRISVRGDDKSVSVLMQARYREHIDDTETGACITTSGLVTEVEEEETYTRIRMESGTVE